jgi:hypothetical protein
LPLLPTNNRFRRQLLKSQRALRSLQRLQKNQHPLLKKLLPQQKHRLKLHLKRSQSALRAARVVRAAFRRMKLLKQRIPMHNC